MEVIKTQVKIPPGYKKTEFGVIPKDWDYIQFGKVVTQMKGGASLTPIDFKSNGVKVLPKSGVTWGGKLNIAPNDLSFCSIDFADKNKSSQVDNTYTIIVLRDLVPSGPNIGLMVEIPGNDTFVLAQGVYGLRFNEDKVHPRFLIHLSNSDAYRRLMRSILVGSTQVHIRNSTLKETKFPLPPTLTEQRAIATALSDVDDLIAALDRLIFKKRAIKLGTMQKLLTGRTRLPGFSGEWELKKLGDILKVRHGKSQHLVVDKNGQYPILATGGQIGWANEYLYDKPSVLIGRKGTIDVPRFMSTPFWTVDTLFYTEISSLANPKFIFYRFHLINWYNYNEASGVPSLNASTIEGIEINFPKDIQEQNAIAQILSDMDAEIESLEQKRGKFRAIKQGMMQELLTGKTRLI